MNNKNAIYLIKSLLKYNPAMTIWLVAFSIITLAELFFERAPYKVAVQCGATLIFICTAIWANTLQPTEIGLFALIQVIYIVCLQKFV